MNIRKNCIVSSMVATPDSLAGSDNTPPCDSRSEQDNNTHALSELLTSSEFIEKIVKIIRHARRNLSEAGIMACLAHL